MDNDIILGLEAHTKIIDCPAHKTHKATLYCYPHELAGVWECPVTGESDPHDCREFAVITSSSTDYSYEKEDIVEHDFPLEVCVDCVVAREDY